MAKFTLFEVHLDDATLTANAPFSSQSGPEEGEDESAYAAEATDLGEEADGPGVAPLVVALVVLVVVAVVVKKLVGGSEDAADDSAE
jgi:hypothetical protein